MHITKALLKASYNSGNATERPTVKSCTRVSPYG